MQHAATALRTNVCAVSLTLVIPGVRRYYNLEQWENKQLEKKRRRLRKKMGLGDAPVRTSFDDEAARRCVACCLPNPALGISAC